MAEKSSVFKVRFDTSAQTQATTSFKGYKKPFLHSIAPFTPHIILVFVSALLYAYTFVMTTRVLGNLIDIFVSAIIASVVNGKSSLVATEFVPEIIKVIIFITANTLFSLLQGIASSSFSTKYSHTIRTKVSHKFTLLPMNFIDAHFHNEFYNLFTDGTDALNQSLNLFFGNYISSLFVVAGILIEIFRIDSFISAIVLLIITIGLIMVYVATFFENKNSSKQQYKAGELYNNVNEFYSGIKIIQHSGNGKSIVKNINQLSESLNTEVKKARKSASIASIVTEGLTALSLITVLVAGAFRIHSAVISLGTLITLIVYIRKLNQPLSQVSSFSNIIRTIKVSLASIFALLSEKELPAGQTGETAIASDLEFDNVSFSYNGTNKVVEKLNFKIRARGITAISGETGAGKSTIIKLILNFYDPCEGTIKMGGKDIAQYDPSSYKKLFTIIPQNAQLFDCTIKENIAYGIENVTDEQIKAAAEKIGANHFIESLPQGYDTDYSSCDGNLSSGQIQLILLTRAFLQRSKFIIFDESTSFIDADTELKLNLLLKKLSEDCGIIIIAHRQTAIGIADNIIKISKGKLI